MEKVQRGRFISNILETRLFVSFCISCKVSKPGLTNIYLAVSGSDDNIFHWISYFCIGQLWLLSSSELLISKSMMSWWHHHILSPDWFSEENSNEIWYTCPIFLIFFLCFRGFPDLPGKFQWITLSSSKKTFLLETRWNIKGTVADPGLFKSWGTWQLVFQMWSSGYGGQWFKTRTY